MKSNQQANLEKGLAILQEYLASRDIGCRVVANSRYADTRQVDAELELPELGARLDIEWRSSLHPGDTDALLAKLRDLASAGDGIPLVMTRRVSETAFAECRKRGISLVDLTGNILLDLPGHSFERYYHAPPPRRLPTAGTVFTAKASRIVRTLLAEPERHWFQAELVERTGLSQGYASRVLKQLHDDQYIVGDRKIRLFDPDRLLDDWVAHYRFDRHEKRHFAVNGRNYEETMVATACELNDAGIRFAFTGWSGAFLRAPYGLSNEVMAYVERLPVDGDNALLFPVDGKGNLVLYVPQDIGVLQNCSKVKDLPVVSDAQLYIDLCKMPGRASDQAQVLREKHLRFEGE